MLLRDDVVAGVESGVYQFAGFIGASAAGMIVNYTVAVYLTTHVLPDQRSSLYLGALAGIASGLTFNFLGNRYVVFRKRYIK